MLLKEAKEADKEDEPHCFLFDDRYKKVLTHLPSASSLSKGEGRTLYVNLPYNLSSFVIDFSYQSYHKIGMILIDFRTT
jgi:hypothetical protein